jgi:hypothetical protein
MEVMKRGIMGNMEAEFAPQPYIRGEHWRFLNREAASYQKHSTVNILT